MLWLCCVVVGVVTIYFKEGFSLFSRRVLAGCLWCPVIVVVYYDIGWMSKMAQPNSKVELDTAEKWLRVNSL